jgi:hypothetical protein
MSTVKTGSITVVRDNQDPEPFTVVVGVAGIVGGVAGAVSLYRSFAPVSLTRSLARQLRF